MKEDKEIQVGSARALVPFLIFVGIYLGAGMFFVSQGDPMGFYVLKAPIAILIGIISGFLIIKGKFDDKFDVFVKGCGDSDIIIMIMIMMDIIIIMVVVVIIVVVVVDHHQSINQSIFKCFSFISLSFNVLTS